MPETSISMSVNGRDVVIDVPPMRPLLDVLRQDLMLSGTKRGCDGGECGACTVLVDGQPLLSCLVPTVNLEGSEVVTIEGLRGDERAGRLARLLAEAHGVQCGYCTPGVMMTLLGAKVDGRQLNAADVTELLQGNLCRCTGYQKIVQAACRFAAEQHATTAGSSDGDNTAMGRSVPRPDGVAKAMGQAQFVDDVVLPGMLHARVLRSPHRSARIVHVDTALAQRVPGVVVILTGADLGTPTAHVSHDADAARSDRVRRYGMNVQDETVLAVNVVRYVGDEVAAVAAVTPEAAAEAIELLHVTYEELPPVLSPQSALLASSARVHEDRKDNVAAEYHLERGDPQTAFDTGAALLE